MLNANAVLNKLLCCANQLLPEDSPAQQARILALPPRQQPFSPVLIIPSRFIGDGILLTPFIQNLRAALGPKAQIDLVANPAIENFFRPFPELSQVYSERAIRSRKKFLSHYQTVFFCHYNYAWAQAAVQAQVPQRIGFDLERLGIQRMKYWGQCLTEAVPSTSALDNRHQVDVYLDMLRQVGLPSNAFMPHCHLLVEDEKRARQWLEDLPDGPLKILIHTSADSPGKRWPYWTELLEALQREYAPMLIATGTRKDRREYQAWERRFPLRNLCGQTSLRESIALMRHVDLVITLDTAVAHMAALAEAPRLVVLYGPTNHIKWRPCVQPGTRLQQVSLKLPCQPCLARTCEEKQCTRGLQVSQVLWAVRQVLQEGVHAAEFSPKRPLPMPS